MFCHNHTCAKIHNFTHIRIVPFLPAGTPVVLELYGCAVGRVVDIHSDGVQLQLGLLWQTRGAQAVQAKS